ncbi:MAG: hypothetical protein DMG11_13155 [Acidobacteria bacterium]|nr:MAG: hypothetical protein DMG11_13155 [Acidobacteriota bacterium]
MKKLLALVAVVGLFSTQAVSDVPANTNSEFIFARVQFNMAMRPGMYIYREAPWHHDYPNSEDLFLTMLKEATGIHTDTESYKIVQLDSQEIFRYPFLYFSEPGYMDLTDMELTNLREYFNRGGFAMFDDFRGRALQNLQYQMKRVFPEREMFKLDLSNPVWKTFYDIDSLEMPPPYMNNDSGTPTFWGMKDDKGHLILIANADNDFGEFWEWVDRGEMPFRPAAQSVRFGINYLVYAMTH